MHPDISPYSDGGYYDPNWISKTSHIYAPIDESETTFVFIEVGDDGKPKTTGDFMFLKVIVSDP
jgi:hypothetical protein